LISGLLPASEFEHLAEICATTNKSQPKSVTT
jgi:hypothetical protein